MSVKLKQLEEELTLLIEKYDIDEMIDCDAEVIAINTTTMWGVMKKIKLSSGVTPRVNKNNTPIKR